MEVTPIIRALEPEVVDAVWAVIEPLIPPTPENHPLGCHRPRVSDRLCFWGILIRLVTGCSWVSVEAILEYQVSDTTLRARRDEWIVAGVFDALRCHAVHAYDRIIGLDLSEVALDGSLHKAPCGGEGTGKNPTDRAKLGWKWSIATDARGIPIGWALDGANRNDVKMLDPTLDDLAQAGLLEEIETLHLDRGYDYPKVRAAGRSRPRRSQHPTPLEARRHRHSETADATWAALGGRRDQLVAEQLWPAPSQHRPANPTPACSALPGRRPAHHCQAHRLAQPMEPGLTAYPLIPLASIHR